MLNKSVDEIQLLVFSIHFTSLLSAFVMHFGRVCTVEL